MASNLEILSSFIEGAPPGELAEVVADIKALTSDGPDLIPSLAPAFRKYNEEQLVSVKLPGSSEEVIVSPYNRLDNDRYHDVATRTSFQFDHVSQASSLAHSSSSALYFELTYGEEIQKASAPRSHPIDSQNFELIESLLKSLKTHAREHYPSCSFGVYPSEDDTSINILLVANKYSPNNFWNGRFRAIYNIPVSSPTTISGAIHVDVHYYEDGNVSLSTTKRISIATASISPAETVIRRIATAERDYQEELNRAFNRMAEDAFKSLRRQLPITRQKIEWEKVGGYRLGQDISGGKGR